jgi:ADP-ribose pyrophosphatase
MLGRLRRISSSLRAENPYWKYNIDRYELPDGAAGEYHWVETPGSVFIIPDSGSGRFVMTRQYRYLNERFSLEFPGGGIDPSIGAEESARMELAQEAGVKAGRLEKIGEFNPFNGVTNEICYVFLARELSKCEARSDDSEEFEIMEISFQEINDKIKQGELWDGMTLAAWSIFTNL